VFPVRYELNFEILVLFRKKWPPLWSSGQFLVTDPEARVRFQALPDFLRSSGSGTSPLSLLSTTEELRE
jgi:hypothetical protein